MLMNSNAERKQVAVVYMGMVQGVGFRWTTRNLAADFTITGFVQNQDDGSVLLVAEGAELELLRFLEALRASPLGRCIRHEAAQWSLATGKFRGFEIQL